MPVIRQTLASKTTNIVSYKQIFILFQMGNSTNFQEIRTRTIAKRNQSLQKYLPIFRGIIQKHKITPERIDKLTRLDLPSLVEELNSQRITSEQLIAIYGERACTIGLRNCIITEEYFQYALNRAKECDEERRRTKKKNWTMEDEWDTQKFLPPLFGVPSSIKDNIEMEGTCSTIGITVRADRPALEDCATIKCLKHTGMIPFIKTNLPQLAFNFDSFNFLWGRTLNPWNHNKSAGGSSGGQGASIASRVSPIGIGNDMAGSIRIPAAFNGVFGLVCSADRLPFWGQLTKYSTGFSGMDTVMCVNGPLSTSVDALALWLKHMTNEQFYLGEHDAYRKVIPFDVKKYKEYSQGKKKLRIGYIESLQLIEPTPAVRRAVVESVAFLKSEGHELVEIQIPNQAELIYCLYTELLSQGDFASFESALEGEPVVPEYKDLSFLSHRSNCFLSCLQCLLEKKHPRLGRSIKAMKRTSTHEYLEHVGRVHEMQQDFIKYWRKNKLDFLILPGFATQASNHGSSKDGSFLATYTYIFNLLRMASSSQPITLTRADELHYESDFEDQITDLIKNNIKDAQGLPVSLQIVTMPFQEEQLLGFSKKIEKHFKFYEKHPLPSNP